MLENNFYLKKKSETNETVVNFWILSKIYSQICGFYLDYNQNWEKKWFSSIKRYGNFFGSISMMGRFFCCFGPSWRCIHKIIHKNGKCLSKRKCCMNWLIDWLMLGFDFKWECIYNHFWCELFGLLRCFCDWKWNCWFFVWNQSIQQQQKKWKWNCSNSSLMIHWLVKY